jgi:bacillithiol biosynthesis cysteine-adding enzyme BshC
VEAAGLRAVAPRVLEAMAAQSARLHSPDSARRRHLEALGRPGTVAVVTGQQVGLFLGPLFTVYKAASAVACARALAEETGRPCVPIFWLQTEDHDVPEVDHCLVPRSTGELLRAALGLQGGTTSRTPVSSLRLGESVQGALAALRAELGGLPHAEEHLSLLERAYHPEAHLGEAFAEVLAALFAEEGLLVLDPRSPRLAPLAAALHRRALLESEAIAAVLTARGTALAAAGFTEQVHIRPGAPLSFVSPEGPQGPRYRLEPGATAGTFRLVGHPGGAQVTTAELLGWLEREPERFTTSALLRPLLQDSWLPSAAYVGGPGEMAYFAQLAPLYAHLGLALPLVVPRARFLVVDERARRLLERLGLTPQQAMGPREALLQRLAATAQEALPPGDVEARLTSAFLAELSQLAGPMKALEPQLSQALVRTEKTVERAVLRLAARYGRALALRSQVTVERLERLRGYLLPEGLPQERVHGLPYYACRYGGRAFVERVLGALRPFLGELQELTP